mmetsp:Transcript_8890/g.32564  ORF Transcript_8890/g.32564 Transcript_8890/m.32564 type:complete len:236 (+) Transcript_8890:165-872(+)
MFRNQYDQDILTWSPHGRLHQVEYAMEAVKQGGASVGCKNKDHAVLVTLNRSASELSSSQRKLFKVDDFVGIAVSGLTADGTALVKMLRSENISHKFTFGSHVDISRLALKVADNSQVSTQRAGARPSGVGTLIAGCDESGCHIFQTCPSGSIYEHEAIAIGARSQASKTFLENNQIVQASSLNELIVFALRALSEASVEPISELTCSVALVGINTPFKLLDTHSLSRLIAQIYQ